MGNTDIILVDVGWMDNVIYLFVSEMNYNLSKEGDADMKQ